MAQSMALAAAGHFGRRAQYPPQLCSPAPQLRVLCAPWWSRLLPWQAADHSQPKMPRQGTCLWHCQLCQELLCGTDHVHIGCKGELAAALAPAWLEMVEKGLGEGEEKNGGWAP